MAASKPSVPHSNLYILLLYIIYTIQCLRAFITRKKKRIESDIDPLNVNRATMAKERAATAYVLGSVQK